MSLEDGAAMKRYEMLEHIKTNICFPECLEQRFSMTRSSTKLQDVTRQDEISIKLFFSSLTKEMITIRPKTELEILCKFEVSLYFSQMILTFLQLKLEESLECLSEQVSLAL